MFQPPATRVDGLRWEACGPGPDPAVILRTWFRVNGVGMAVAAFRVPMPLSAGWTTSLAWEDDKGMHGAGLLWNPSAYRAAVEAADRGTWPGDHAPSNDEGSRPDGTMLEVEAGWLGFAASMGWPGSRWKPAVLGGAPYMIVGWFAGARYPGGASVELSVADERTWFGQKDREHKFNVTIEGSPCTLACIEVRSLGAVGTSGACIGLDASGKEWLARAGSALGFVGGDACTPFVAGGRAMAGFLAPADPEEWGFDYRAFCTTVSSGLPPGRARWMLSIPGRPLDRRTARALEGCAAAVRERSRISRLGMSACVVARPDTMGNLLGLPRSSLRGDSPDWDTIGRVNMVGIARVADGSYRYSSQKAMDRIYAFPDAAFLGISPAFVHVAEHTAPNAMLLLARQDAVLEVPAGDPSAYPAWLSAAPPVADGRIRGLVADIARS